MLFLWIFFLFQYGFSNDFVHLFNIGILKSVPANNEFLVDDFVPDERNATEIDIDENNEPVNNFERSSNCGAFRLESYDFKAGDILPPGSITDLTVTSWDFQDDYYQVSLKFTTPGDDLIDGQGKQLVLFVYLIQF